MQFRITDVLKKKKKILHKNKRCLAWRVGQIKPGVRSGSTYTGGNPAPHTEWWRGDAVGWCCHIIWAPFGHLFGHKLLWTVAVLLKSCFVLN